MRLQLTRARTALGWVCLALAGLSGTLLTAATYASRDVEFTRALWWAWLLLPLPLALTGATLHLTGRSLNLDFSARTLTAPGTAPLRFDRLRAVWLMTTGDAGAVTLRWRTLIVTDAMPAALLEALQAAEHELSAANASVPMTPYLRGPGVLEALRAPPADGLIPVLETAWQRAALNLVAELAARLQLPVLDMTNPKAPSLRRLD